MTNQEWESGMNDLRQAQLATQRLIELNIAAFDKRLEATDKKWDQRFDRLTSIVESYQAQNQAQIAELRAAMTSLVAHIDNYIQGRGPNGQKGTS